MSNELFLQKYIDALVEEVTELTKSKIIIKANLESEKFTSSAKDEYLKQFQEMIQSKDAEIGDLRELVESSKNDIEKKDSDVADANHRCEERQAKINDMSIKAQTNVSEIKRLTEENNNQAKAIAELMNDLKKYKDAESHTFEAKKVSKKTAVSTA